MKYLQSILVLVAVCVLSLTPATLRAGDPVISIPSGTIINVRMIDSISSDRNHAGETFRGALENSIRVGNRTVLPRGANAYVRLAAVHSAGRVKGRSELVLRLERVEVRNHNYLIHSQAVSFRGKSEGKKTAKSAGIGAAVGGGLGALFGGGTGAAVGAGLGAGTGVAANAARPSEQVRIGSESLVQFRLAAPLRVQE